MTTHPHPTRRLPLVATVAAALVMQLTVAIESGRADTTFSLSNGSATPTAGSYAPGSSFTLSVTLNVTNATSGYSLWFDTATANAGFFSIGSFTLTSAAFPDATSANGPQGFGTANAGRSGFLSNLSDLGATTTSGTAAPGSYMVQNVTFLIDPSAAAGVYTLQTTPTGAGGRVSGSSGGGPGFVFESAPSSAFTVTVVPEPSTWALIAGGLLTLVGVQRVRRQNLRRTC